MTAPHSPRLLEQVSQTSRLKHFSLKTEKSYTYYNREWIWQYVFPTAKRSVDPRSGIIRRHHVHDDSLQRAVKRAIQARLLQSN